MKQNLAFLKKSCYDVNWLQEWVDLQEIQPQTGDLGSESGDSSTKQARKRRLPCKDDELLECPFEGCEKTYLSKTSLRLHIRRQHKPDSAMKETSDPQVAEFGPILRGVKLERVFKKEDFVRLNYTKGGCQNEELNSTKKVKDASDEYKQESDASDLIQKLQDKQNFNRFHRNTIKKRKVSASKANFSSCCKSIEGTRPLTIISNDRSCTKTRGSVTASTNATALKQTVSQNTCYKEDSELNSVIGFDKSHFVASQNRLDKRFGDEELRLGAEPEDFCPDSQPSFLCGEGDFSFEAFHRYKNRSFSICDENVLGDADGIFGSSSRKGTDLVNEVDYKIPDVITDTEQKHSCCGRSYLF